jgi:hypothetical protein
VKNFGFRISDFGFGIWNLEFGIWNLEFGIWNLPKISGWEGWFTPAGSVHQAENGRQRT